MEKRHTLPISVQLLLEKEDKILLMKRKNTGYEDGKYCLPGWHVEAHEEIREALIREAKEEIGIDIDMQDIKFYKVMNRKVNSNQEYIDFIFKANHWTGEITNEENNKCEEIIWANKKNLPKNILSFIPEILKNDKVMYLPYNWDEN